MRGIELDDDENIDPDRDFSYIDWKLENFLGHFQKDFMRGFPADRLGPIFGGYGSFLPMQERSPPVLSGQRSQNDVSAKYPSNPPSEHISQNPTVAATATASASASLPARTVPGFSNHSGQFQSESGISSVNNKLEVKNTSKCASNFHQQQEKSKLCNSKQNSLKLRVKMASNSVMTRDKAAIYSGLGLDMSPSSSPEATPVEKHGTFPGFQEMNPESPSFIVKTMTSILLPNEVLISPLHDGLICLMELENTVETGLLGACQVEPLSDMRDSAYLDVKEAIDEKKPKLKDTFNEKNTKQVEASKKIKPKQNTNRQNPTEFSKDVEFPANFSDFSAIKREEIGTSLGKQIVSNTLVNAVACPSKETGMVSDSRPSNIFDKKSEVGCLGEVWDNYTNQGKVGRHKVKEEFSSVLSDAAVVDAGTAITRKTNKDGNKIVIPKDEHGTEKRKEFAHRQDESDKFLKQHNVVKVKVKEDFDSLCPKNAYGSRKASGKYEKIAKDTEDPQGIKHDESVSSKQNLNVKAMLRLQMNPCLDESSSSLGKTKLKDFQIGIISSSEPPRGSVVRSNGPGYEEGIRKTVPSRNKREDVDLLRNLTKNSEIAVVENPSKKGKYVSSRCVGMGVTAIGAQQYANKSKNQPSSKKIVLSNSGPKLGGDVGDICLMRVGDLPPIENASIVPLEMDDWVQCEKCQKWRLLPFGTNPDSLPKEWICSMLTWLPGMNKCSFSEDETTHALRALYLPLASGPALLAQNDQQAHLDGSACVKTFPDAPNVGLPKPAVSNDDRLSRGRKKNISKLEVHAAGKSGAEDLHRPSKKDLRHSGGNKNLKKLPQQTSYAGKNAVCRPSEIPKKRMAEVEASGVPKKIKNMHQKSMASSGHAGLLPSEVKGESQNYNTDGRGSPDIVHGSSKCLPLKGKNRRQSVMVAMDDGLNDVSEKRKLKDQLPSANAKGDGRKRNLSHVDDNNPHQVPRVGGPTLERCLMNPVSPKIVDARKSSEKGVDFGLTDNATTLSLSKKSTKVKLRARSGVIGSPAGSTPSSPLKVCKSDLDKVTNKVYVSYNKPENLSSTKRLKSMAQGACASNEAVPHNEEMDRKSNLSRTAGMISTTGHEDQIFMKVSSGRRSNAHRVDVQTKLEEFKRHDGKLDHVYHGEGTVVSQQNQETQLPNGLHFDGTSLDRQKLLVADIGGEKESLFNPHCVSELEKGSGSNAVRADTAHASKDIEASSSTKMNSFQWAVTALKEARDLKHSANRLKTSGLGFSTGLFFQAALKFLHGASLLEPGKNENGRIGEMSSAEVYSSTAKLCEYCAHEFEKCNDMASAALAYKCMEVAYMRVVYNNDPSASRDRVELQMAVRTAPQGESPSSSASDVDNLNNQMAIESIRDGYSAMDNRDHVISAGNRSSFARLLSFTHDINNAMEASRRSQAAFAIANLILAEAGNEEGISSIKRALDFSFHDVEGLLHLVRRAMEALNN